MSTTRQFAAALWIAAAALTASAQQNPVETRLEARKVTVAADGRESFGSAESARPGDVIEYTATYRNTGKAAVRNLEATLPIPADTEFVHGSVKPAGARASLDSNVFSPLPLVRKVVRDGREVEEQVPAREYRSLRWYPGELGAGQAATFNARVRVLSDRVPVAPTGKGSPK